MARCVRPGLSRSAIHQSLRHHGVSQRVTPVRPAPGQFEITPFGFVHIDLKHLPRLDGIPCSVFVAIERTTRFVDVEIIERRDSASVAGCLERCLAAFGYPVHTILTDNGSGFTDRFALDMKGKPHDRPSGRHPFDRVCADHAIAHRLTKPFHPQTNGMVERFNRRIVEAIANAPASTANRGRNRFANTAERTSFLLDFAHACNRTRLKCLDYTTPSQALGNHTGDYTQAGGLLFDARRRDT